MRCRLGQPTSAAGPGATHTHSTHNLGRFIISAPAAADPGGTKETATDREQRSTSCQLTVEAGSDHELIRRFRPLNMAEREDHLPGGHMTSRTDQHHRHTISKQSRQPSSTHCYRPSSLFLIVLPHYLPLPPPRLFTLLFPVLMPFLLALTPLSPSPSRSFCLQTKALCLAY